RLTTSHSTATTGNSDSNPVALKSRTPSVSTTRTRTVTITGSAAAAAVHSNDPTPAGDRRAAGRMTRWGLTSTTVDTRLRQDPPARRDPCLPGGRQGSRCELWRSRTACGRDRSHRLEELLGQSGGLGRRLADLDAGGLEGLLLCLGRARRAGDDGAGVAHGLALGRGEAGDVADDRLGHVVLDVLGGTLLGVATDLADHDDDLGLRIVLEGLDAIDVRGADDRVTTDADGGREAV